MASRWRPPCACHKIYNDVAIECDSHGVFGHNLWWSMINELHRNEYTRKAEHMNDDDSEANINDENNAKWAKTITFLPIRFHWGKMKPFMVSDSLGLALSMWRAGQTLEHKFVFMFCTFDNFAFPPSPCIWPSASFQSLQNNKSFRECRVLLVVALQILPVHFVNCVFQREIDMARWQFSIFCFWFFFCLFMLWPSATRLWSRLRMTVPNKLMFCPCTNQMEWGVQVSYYTALDARSEFFFFNSCLYAIRGKVSRSWAIKRIENETHNSVYNFSAYHQPSVSATMRFNKRQLSTRNKIRRECDDTLFPFVLLVLENFAAHTDMKHQTFLVVTYSSNECSRFHANIRKALSSHRKIPSWREKKPKVMMTKKEEKERTPKLDTKIRGQSFTYFDKY